MWKSGLMVAAIVLGVMLILSLIANALYFGVADSLIYNLGGRLDINIENGGGMVIFDIGGIFTVMLFIVGICAIREDLRLFIQHGMGRKTTYICNILIGIIAAIGAGFFSELLALLSANFMLFSNGIIAISDNFFVSWLLRTLSLFFAWQLGTMISLIYYRLNTIMKVLFSVVAGVLFLGILPISIINIFDVLFPSEGSVLANFFVSPLTLGLVMLGMGVICTVISFPLIRRAPTKV